MSVLIYRADAGPEMGVGHVMRGLALAEQWMAWGGEAVFCGHCESDALRAQCEHSGARWFEAGLTESPAIWVGKALAESRDPGAAVFAPWVVLDGYHFDSRMQAQLRDLDVFVLILDDLANRAPYDAALVLNQNAGARRDRYPDGGASPRYLLGPAYALIRQYIVAQRHDSPRTSVGGRILITMGGADPRNASAVVLKALEMMPAVFQQARVLVGVSNPHCAALDAQVAGMSMAVELRCATSDMVAELRWADLVVAAPGVTALEMSCLGIPAAYLVTADNQRPGVEALAEAGAALLLGELETQTPQSIASILTRALADRESLTSRARQGQVLVDGRGARRVVQAMRQCQVRVRAAEHGDAKQIFEWANDHTTRSVSFNSAPIDWESHCRWFEDALKNASQHLFILETDRSHAVGIVRFQASDVAGECLFSINLSPAMRGMGLGAPCIRAACEVFFESHPECTIVACIKPDNRASLAAFEQAGFGDASRQTVSGCEAICMRLKGRQLEVAA